MAEPSIQLTLLPLSKLDPSPLNIRRAKVDDASNEELDASIAAHGVLENLIVGKGVRGKYAVIAGGRRLAALCRLRDRGAIGKTHPVPCLVADTDEQTQREMSLAENIVRVAMHPADQIDVWGHLFESGMRPETIAQRFGCTRRLVDERLKLTRIHAEVREGYREGKMGLDALRAFTLSDDPAEQKALFDREVGEGRVTIQQWQVREALTDTMMSAEHPLARHAGLKAYEKAGGGVVRDLLSDDDDLRSLWLKDHALVRSLSMEKLERAAKKVSAEGWSWVRCQELFDFEARRTFKPLKRAPAKPTKAEAATLDDVTKRMDELRTTAGKAREWHELEHKIREIRAALTERGEWSDDDLARSGAVLAVSHDGKTEVWRALVECVASEAKSARRDDGAKREADEPGGAPYSAALREDLAFVRGSLIKAAVAGAPDVAFDLLVFELCARVLGGQYAYLSTALESQPNHAETRPPSRRDVDDWVETWVGGEPRLGEIHDGLNIAWFDKDDLSASWEGFMTLSLDEKRALMAYFTATSMISQLSDSPTKVRYLERVVESLDIPYHEGIHLETGSFWSRLSKGQMLAVAREHLPEAQQPDPSLKKGDMAKHMAARFDRAAADRPASVANWVPPGILPDSGATPE